MDNLFSYFVFITFTACGIGLVGGSSATGPLTPRLVGGSDVLGQLEIRYKQAWGTVCQKGWGNTESQVACKHMALPFENARMIVAAQLNGSITAPWMWHVSCEGSESELDQCQYNMGNIDSCTPVTILCTDNPEYVHMQLADSHGNYGRLEVNIGGVSGTVCSTWSYTMTTLRVMCRHMGKTGFATAVRTWPGMEQGTGHVWGFYFNCDFDFFGIEKCRLVPVRDPCTDHSRDIVIFCFDEDVREFPIRLANSSIPNAGRVELQLDDVWGAVGRWKYGEEYTFCKIAGQPTDMVFSVSGAYGNMEDGPMLFSHVSCGGGQVDNLYFCTMTGVPETYRHNDGAVFCADNNITFDVRLVPLSSSNFDRAGVVEVSIAGVWFTVVADIGQSEAQVICRQLGLPSDRPIVSRRRCSQCSSWPYTVRDMQCNGTEQNVGQCTRLDRQTLYNEKNAHVFCAGEFEVMLQNLYTSSPGDGLLLAQLPGGPWESVCYHGVNLGAAKVICNQLGFQAEEVEVMPIHSSNDEVPPTLFKNITCAGHEDNIGACAWRMDRNKYCNTSLYAGIVCGSEHPKRVKIIGSESGMLALDSATVSTVRCQAGRAMPPPALAWYLNGVLLNTTSERVKMTSYNRYRVTSRLKLRVTEKLHDTKLSCRYERGNTTVQRKVALFIKVPVVSVFISKVFEMNNYIYQCVTSAARPAPHITWFIDNRKYNGKQHDLDIGSSTGTNNETGINTGSSKKISRSSIVDLATSGHDRAPNTVYCTAAIDTQDQPAQSEILSAA